jgi:hypothetical protein
MSALGDAELIGNKDNFVSLLDLCHIKFYVPISSVAVVTHHGEHVIITYRRK